MAHLLSSKFGFGNSRITRLIIPSDIETKPISCNVINRMFDSLAAGCNVEQKFCNEYAARYGKSKNYDVKLPRKVYYLQVKCLSKKANKRTKKK